MRGPFYLAAFGSLVLASVLAVAAAGFATAHELPSPNDLRIGLWLHDAAGWTVGAALFLLAATRLARRPVDAWVAAFAAAVVVTGASFNPLSVPRTLALAATIAGALAPWPALAFPPSRRGLAFVVLNLAFVVAAPWIAQIVPFPWWLRGFAPIDPLTIPSWLSARPLQWPWIVVAAPVVFGAPAGCCAALPASSPVWITAPAALLGFVIWYGGRGRPRVPVGRRGPAGSAMRRG